MNILLHVLMGLVVGWTARFFLPGHDRWGVIMTSIIGMLGAWAGPEIAQRIGVGRSGGFVGFLYAVGGAMLVLLILRQL